MEKMNERTCWVRYKHLWALKLHLKLCKKGAESAEFKFLQVLKMCKKINEYKRGCWKFAREVLKFDKKGAEDVEFEIFTSA